MLKLFKKFRLLVIIPSIITIIFVSLSVIPTNYDLYLPATVDDIGEIYTFEGIDTSDVNVSSVSVYSLVIKHDTPWAGVKWNNRD